MNRHDVLTEAARLTAEDRNRTYGPPIVNHSRIAAIWSVILGIEVTPAQVCLCMIGTKISRLVESPQHIDSFVDAAAYAALAAECATEEPCATSEPSSPASTAATASSSPSSSTTEPGMPTTLPGHSDLCCRTFPAATY